MRRLTCLILACAAFSVPLRAEAACAISYEFFEVAVPHLDLEACPSALARPGTFCRASTSNDAVNLFVFSAEGERCLVATRRYPVGEFQLTIK